MAAPGRTGMPCAGATRYARPDEVDGFTGTEIERLERAWRSTAERSVESYQATPRRNLDRFGPARDAQLLE